MDSQALKPPLTLIIGNPPQDGQINIGEKLTVTGLVAGRGGAEPNQPQSVTVQLGGLPPVRATLKPPRIRPRNTTAPPWTYTAVFESVTLPPGPTTLSVDALFDSNEHAFVEETVLASDGGTTLESTFTADITLKTSSSEAAGPDHDTISIGALFSGDRRSVVFTFPQLSVGGATVTLIAGGVGTVDVSTVPVVSGVMNIPVSLNFNQEINQDSTLSVTLTTGAEQSPHGNFTDKGAPLDALGNVKLVADGSFVGGHILDGSDASLVIQGAFSPAPIQQPGRLP